MRQLVYRAWVDLLAEKRVTLLKAGARFINRLLAMVFQQWKAAAAQGEQNSVLKGPILGAPEPAILASWRGDTWFQAALHTLEEP